MDLLIGLVVLAVIGVMAFGGLFLVINTGLNRADRTAQANAPETLNATFDGSRTVTFEINGLAGLTYDQVVIGARERGYTLTHDSGADRYGGRTLIFDQSSRTT